ncbi:alpha/beta hydrolase [Rhizobium paknamense]|uniref:Carboxylesterase n=1 Tax=Rhizobium paknamense TaxID=1206817 RepID=A0ABU0IC24_9HYPH|nr:alpha/beta fold hydrolase [Rhizobium paknamense]MDQ0455741.1 carboxylesterase [Rhizobium paknamense]
MKLDRLAFHTEGTNGLGVLLIHGLTGAPAEMRLVARQFAKRGFSVYAPLLAGHGKDAATLRRTRWQDWLDSVEEAAADFRAEVKDVFTAGICAGGKLGLMAADRRPDLVKAAALYSPCFHYDGWNIPRHYALMARQIRWLSKIPFMDRLNFQETASMGIKDERIRKMVSSMSNEGVLESFPGRGLVEMEKLARALKARLPALKTPTLIVHSREDDVSSPEHARYIAEHLGGEKQLHWLTDSYHMIHVDRQHRQVADLTADFFEKHHADDRS